MKTPKNGKITLYKQLLIRCTIFIAAVTVVTYFLPRDGKFNYQFDINKPWKYGQLIATFDFPIYKDNAVVKQEQDSLMAAFQPFYNLDKNAETEAVERLRKNFRKTGAFAEKLLVSHVFVLCCSGLLMKETESRRMFAFPALRTGN